MILDQLDIPDELLEAQEQGKLVVFAGAGVSRGAPSDLPDFNGLAVEVAQGTRFENEFSNHIHRLDRYFGEMVRGGVAVEREVRKRIGDPASLPTDLHRWILDLFQEQRNIRIVTTNFDTHFTRLLKERKIDCDQYFAPALPLGRNFRGIVYLHGSLLRKDDPLVLSDEDFGRAYMTDGWARDFLREMFDTYTTLFIGYSHTDTPVEYLARGMSSIRVGPRYALVSRGDKNRWDSLNVIPITFEKPGGDTDYSELSRGLHAWAQFSKEQPTDIALKVRDILRTPPEVKPAKSQSSLLVRCISRKDECHFFTSEANDWRWVEWANEQGLLKPLFAVNQNNLDEPSDKLAMWLAKMLLAESSDRGLLLVAEHGGTPGPTLWLHLGRKLWPYENPDLSIPLLQKWMLLLVNSCPDIHKNKVGHFLAPVAKAAPKTLGLVLFRFLTNFRITVSSGWTFDTSATSGHLGTKTAAEFDLVLIGESFHLEESWESVFKPLIPALGPEYLRILNDRLSEMYITLRTCDRADKHCDPWSMRRNIQQRDLNRGFHNNSLVVDLLLDVVEAMSSSNDGLPARYIEEWLSAEVPTLVRVGLLALRLDNRRSSRDKVKMFLGQGLLFPLASCAEQEANSLLVHCYPDLTQEERSELWHYINQGPKWPRPEDVATTQWEKLCQHEVDKLTGRLAIHNKDCPLATDALKSSKERSPEFQEQSAINTINLEGEVFESDQSPISTADLLSKKICSQIEFLINYQGEKWPSRVTRAGLVAVVGDACSQNADWAMSLFEELDRRQEWRSDLWQGAFWRLKISSVSAERLGWLLEVIEKHFDASHELKGLTTFLFNGLEFSEQKAPSDEILHRMLRISLNLWQQITATETKRIDDFDRTEWTTRAINHPAGHIVDFWLKALSYIRTKPNVTTTGWPEWIRDPLEDIIDGNSYAAQLGRTIIGNQMPFVHGVDPLWTRGRLFQKFIFSQAGDEAFLLWEPHLKYGRLSRDLIVEMIPIYRQSFQRFRNVSTELATHLYKHVAIIVCSCLVDVTKDGWLTDFIVGLTEEQRGAWASQIESILRGVPKERKETIWNKWMKNYWLSRLSGKPCKLSNKEAGEMVDWALALEPVFGEAVELVVQMQTVDKQTVTVIHDLERKTLFENHPEPVIQLLSWILTNCRNDFPPGEKVHRFVMKLPRKTLLVPGLLAICEQLAKLGYTSAIEARLEIQEKFVEPS